MYTTIKPGIATPMGASKTKCGWNFSIYSPEKITALLLAPIADSSKIQILPLDSEKNCTGTIWHIAIDTEEEALYYGYLVNDQFLVDPYAQFVETGNIFGKNLWERNLQQLLGIAAVTPNFDWEGDTLLKKPLHELIIYEMHVRGFTQDSTSLVEFPGTYLGVKEKINYLQQIGITAVEFLPIQEFNETEYLRINSKTDEKLYNYWGYSPLSFFSLMQRYQSTKNAIQGVIEFKELVKELHRAGIEVILDLVFNHTGEGNQYGRQISWKGFSPSEYYLLNSAGEYSNFSGCGNTLNCNNPIVQDMIIDSLRYLVTEFHVDGFRFDLASILTRGREGFTLEDPPLIDRITHDPLLKDCKLIAEPWDAAGLHQVGDFYQVAWKGQGRWIEWNDSFRSVVRCFIKGDLGLAGSFATKLCGSQDIYGKVGSPLNSINYITCHDGFTLHDLVSYNYKHNLENCEENQDGANYNESWNCGYEGETDEESILILRTQQMKNFFVALFFSQGVPMLQMGDEYGHTKNGNNNTWCHDNEKNWFLWDKLNGNRLHQFVKNLIDFRKKHEHFFKKIFLSGKEIDWHGREPFHPDWGKNSQLVAYVLKDIINQSDLYIAFNASNKSIDIRLPNAYEGKKWGWVIDTSSILFDDCIDYGALQTLNSNSICLQAHSAVVLLQQYI